MSDRKPILVIDDKKRYPDPGPFRDLVQFRSEIDPKTPPDPSAYATAFVHARPDWQPGWAKRRFELAFVFSGGRTLVDKDGNLYLLTRDVYERQFESFLARYAEAGELEPSIFMEHVVATSQASDEVSSDAVVPAGYVSFTTGAPDLARRVFAIQKGEEGVDYAATLDRLEAISALSPIALSETYVSAGDGLELLMRLRLSVSRPYSRWPVYLRLDGPIIDRRLRPQIGALLFTLNTHVVDTFPALKGLKLDELTNHQLLEVLNELPVRPEGMRGAHDLANEWGPVRLWRGFDALRPAQVPTPDWVEDQERRLQNLEHYAYLMALARLRAAGDEHEVVEEQAKESHRKWVAFLRSHAQGTPLQVLLIDDEIEAGWGSALESIFGEVPGAAHVNTDIADKPFNYKTAERLALSRRWDLVLCDLRLTGKDAKQRGREARDGYDPAGLNLLRAIKADNPTTPVIAFTASRKAWARRRLEGEGADGFWTKEGPDGGASDAYSASHVADLLNQIRLTVRRRDRLAFLWNFVEELGEEETRKRLVQPYTALYPPDIIAHRLDAIRDLLVRAYGYLNRPPTEFQRAVYAQHPVEIAFLHAWGCVNEVLLLRFKNESPSRGLMMTAAGEIVPYYDESSGTPAPVRTVMNPFPCKGEERELRLEQREVKDLSPRKPSGSQAKPDSNGHMRLLLLHEGRCDLDDNFGRYREHIRNRLDLIHGDSSERGRNTHECGELAKIEDVEGLTRLLRHVLYVGA